MNFAESRRNPSSASLSMGREGRGGWVEVSGGPLGLEAGVSVEVRSRGRAARTSCRPLRTSRSIRSRFEIM
ncbi:hypothetical protein BDY24DRAFT_401830 [Mrakia frigida]|uniref:uncharacterized protein n=1 Tax=Mrakia frigida TaxID=29902 RepID=UPI003FCBF5D0